ncbi:MAG: NAD-dependent epimerase/dehydratase family protein [bacterium]
MKILITGGAGFIGSHIADAYINDGHNVVVLDDLSRGSTKNINSKVRFYEMSVNDEDILTVFEKERPEIMSHHAARINVANSLEDPAGELVVTINGFLNLMEAGRRHGLRKVIFASSAAVYANTDKLPTDESHPTDPASPYGLGKLMIEQLLRYYGRTYDINWVALRYANVYGPRQNGCGEAGVVAAFLEKMLANRQPVIDGSGDQTRDFIHVSDVVEANRTALKDVAQGIYNVGTGVETDINKVFNMLRELTGSHCQEHHGPVRNRDLERNSISCRRFQTEFGWRPVIELPVGIKTTVEWFLKNKS